MDHSTISESEAGVNILGVSASRRKWGNTDILVQFVLRGANEAGAVTRFMRLTDIEIQQCQGCLACLLKDRDCRLTDGFCEFLVAMRQADAVVIGSPVYMLFAAGSIQQVIPRLFRYAYTREFAGKPGIALAACGSPGFEGFGLSQVAMFFLNLGMPIIDRFVGYGQGPGEVLADTTACKRALEDGKALGRGESTFRGDPGLCPVCHADLLMCGRDGHPFCQICGLPGRWVELGASARFEPLGEARPRWDAEKLRKHFDEGIRPSGERFRSRRSEILEKLEELKSGTGFLRS